MDSKKARKTAAACVHHLHSQAEMKTIVERGTLVESSRPPDTYYNGWYPVRRCSYSVQVEPRLGKSFPKTTEFRGDGVVCKYCDKGTSDGAQNKPNTICHGKAVNRGIFRVKKGEDGVDNKHWRYHDPHAWMDRPTLPEKCNMHPHNWFREQIDLDLRAKQQQSAEQKQERFKRYKEQQHADYRAALRDAEKKLKEQQQRASFNNPIEHTPPPLPTPPTDARSHRASLQQKSVEPSAVAAVVTESANSKTETDHKAEYNTSATSANPQTI